MYVDMEETFCSISHAAEAKGTTRQTIYAAIARRELDTLVYDDLRGTGQLVRMNKRYANWLPKMTGRRVNMKRSEEDPR